MDEIRKNILHEQEVRKARLNAHFEQSFSANGTVNENGRDAETTATKSADEVHKEVKRQSSVMKAVDIDSTDEALDILKAAGTEDLFEKAKHQDGDMHPNGKWVWVASAAGGKGDWRTAGGRAHSKSQAGGSGSAAGSGTGKVSSNGGTTTTVQPKPKTVDSGAKTKPLKTTSTPKITNYSSMDVKDARKALKGKIITISGHGFNGYKETDWFGKITQVRTIKNFLGKTTNAAIVEDIGGNQEIVPLEDIDNKQYYQYSSYDKKNKGKMNLVDEDKWDDLIKKREDQKAANKKEEEERPKQWWEGKSGKERTTATYISGRKKLIQTIKANLKVKGGTPEQAADNIIDIVEKEVQHQVGDPSKIVLKQSSVGKKIYYGDKFIKTI